MGSGRNKKYNGARKLSEIEIQAVFGGDVFVTEAWPHL